MAHMIRREDSCLVTLARASDIGHHDSVQITLRVEGAPPVRANPSRSADRYSPNAFALAEECQRLVQQEPERFPLSGPVGITLRLGASVPETDALGYEIEDPIVEVMADTRLLADERQVRWVRCSRDPRRDDYEVTVERE